MAYKWKKYNAKTNSVPYTYQDTETYTDYEPVYEKKTKGGSATAKTTSEASRIAQSYAGQGYSVSTSVHPDGTGGTYYIIVYMKEVLEITGNKPVTKTRTVNRTGYRNETVKGTYISDVTSSQRYAYPENGEQGGYWYEYAGLANQAPTITGSSISIGNVKSDFDISYTVSDPDGDEVKVQVAVDNKVIQYPMPVPLNRARTVRIRLADYSLGNHTITVTATDSSNASSTRTYYFSKTNEAPTISGSDLDLGGKYQDFQVDYIVQDADGDAVKVEIKLDDRIVQTPSTTTLGVRRYYTVPIKDVGLGRHKIEIIATDSQGASSVRIYKFEKVNSAPTISGSDLSLGSKNTGFTYTYKVFDKEADQVKVVEKLNGVTIRTLDNAPLDTDLSITVTDKQIRDYDLNKVNTIEISATDGTATTYRRVTFVRNNMSPIISDVDKDMGNVINAFTYNWSATDSEKDKMTAVVYLDDKIYKARYTLPEGANQTLEIKGMDMLKLQRGKHEIRIVVEDDKGFSSTRKITFTRVINRLVMKLAGNGIETDELAKRVMVSDAGIYVAKGAVVKYEVCNNSFDDKPTWEDATTMVAAKKAFNFQNKTKTANKAGVDIRVTIEKGTSTMQSYISAIGGSFD